MSPLPSPSPKWLQLSGPQIGTAGTAWPAAHPPPVSVCERGSRPTSAILHSLLVAAPTCPLGARGQPPSLGLSLPAPRSDYNAGSVHSAPPARSSRLSRTRSASALGLPALLRGWSCQSAHRRAEEAGLPAHSPAAAAPTEGSAAKVQVCRPKRRKPFLPGFFLPQSPRPSRDTGRSRAHWLYPDSAISCPSHLPIQVEGHLF